MSTAYRNLPAVRITNGWRTFYVYDAAGVFLGTHEGFHEEAARREIGRNQQLDFEALKAETRKRAA